MTEILQSVIPYAAKMDSALPGIGPLDADDWVQSDDAFAGQMALRDHIIATRPDDVVAICGASDAAMNDVLAAVLAVLRNRPAYHVADDHVIRPDGVHVPLSGPPMITAARLVQEDLCLHEKHGDEHVMTAAVLCFPASWTLKEKIGKPLSVIHRYVDDYDPNVARRVQRLFDGVQIGRPLWRYNLLRYQSPALFHPRLENAPRHDDDDGQGAYLRSEHQALVRMPASGAVLFAIHTYIVHDPLV